MSNHRRRKKYVDQPNSDYLSQGLNSLAGLMKNMDISQIAGMLNSVTDNVKTNETRDQETDVKNADIVKAIQTLLNADKTEVISTVLQLYALNKQNK